MDLKELKTTAKELLAYAEKKKEVKQAEAYVAANSLNVYRIVYHSHIPSNGLEEPKSDSNFGLSLRILFKDGKYGFGSTDSSLDKEAFEEAYDKAYKSRVNDTDFHSLPEPSGKSEFKGFTDKAIIKPDEEKAIQKAYDLLDGVFTSLGKKKAKAGLNITGEMDLESSAMAIASTTGISAADEHTGTFATLTVNIEDESLGAGTGFSSNTHLGKLDCLKVGEEAARKATKKTSHKKLESGNYKVVLSTGAVTELFYSRFDLGANSVDYNSSPFIGKAGSKVAVEELTVTDEPHLDGMMGSKAYNDEGRPTKTTKLIEKGTLVNYLSNDYYMKKAKQWEKYPANNGFRGGPSRNYFGDVGISGTNIKVKEGKMKEDELIKEIRNGVYVGRLWYTYPINGYSNPDFTSTIRGDSFIIENGEITAALTPNSMRVLDSFDNFMNNIIGIGKKAKAMQSWAQQEVIVTPEIALSSFRLQKISTGK